MPQSWAIQWESHAFVGTTVIVMQQDLLRSEPHAIWSGAWQKPDSFKFLWDPCSWARGRAVWHVCQLLIITTHNHSPHHLTMHNHVIIRMHQETVAQRNRGRGQMCFPFKNKNLFKTILGTAMTAMEELPPSIVGAMMTESVVFQCFKNLSKANESLSQEKEFLKSKVAAQLIHAALNWANQHTLCKSKKQKASQNQGHNKAKFKLNGMAFLTISRNEKSLTLLFFNCTHNVMKEQHLSQVKVTTHSQFALPFRTL